MYWQKITRSFSFLFFYTFTVFIMCFSFVFTYTHIGGTCLIFNTNTSKLKELEIEPMTFLLVVIHSIPEQETGA